MIRRPPRSTLSSSSAASDVYKRQVPVQAGLWLLPLIALAGLKWRDHLIWAGVEATNLVAVWLYIAGLSKPDRGLPPGLYAVLLGLRLATWLYVLLQVWRVARSRGPANPPEAGDQEAGDRKQKGEADPLAGPLAGAADQVLVRI